MIKVEIEDKVYDIPSNWMEVNLDLLMKMNELNKIEFSTDVDRSVSVITTLTKIEKDKLMELSIEDFKELASLFDWVSVLPEITTPEKSFEIDGITYTHVNYDTMTTGETISLEVLQKNDAEANIPLIAAILIRPEIDGKIEKLKDMTDIQRRGEILKEKLMVGLYWPIVQSFFLGAVSSSLTNTQDSSDHPKRVSKFKIVNS
jgi:hypothetical protein